jgi:hypothetical protein
MAKNRVEAGMIEKRLGRSSSSGGSSHEPGNPRSEGSSSSGNTLFAFSLVAVFLVGAGALAASNRGADFRQAIWEDVMGPPPEAAYQSRVAHLCDKGWKDDRLNRDQIHCWMTENVARLCDPRERRALADKLVAYQEAQDRSQGRMGMAALKMIANPGATLALGVSDARSRDPNLSEKERAAQFEKAMDISKEIMAPADQVVMDNVNTATREVVVADFKNLVEHGYLAATDFPDTQPKIVKEVLATTGAVGRSTCR